MKEAHYKKAFLLWADKESEVEPLIEKLKEESYRVVYWVGIGEKTNKDPEMIFHDHYSAWEGNPALALSEKSFPPPSASLIESLYKTESLVLTMMHKRFDDLGVDARRHLYYKMLGYWAGVFDMLKPELIVFPTVPHTVYNYIVYALAKLKGVKTVMLEDTWVGDRMLLYKDWQEGSAALQKAILKNNGKIRKEDLSPELQEYFESQTETRREDATPIYMQHWKKQNSALNRFLKKMKAANGALRNGTFFNRALKFIFKIGKATLKSEYEMLAKNPNLEDSFVYVPLSFQPERTTSPQGDMYVDQILMIQTIASALPEGWKIYVKEHPSQWWLRTGIRYNSARYPGYYREIAKIKGVTFVPIHTNSFHLILKSKAVAVVTGTAGFEAVLRGKSVLLFGYPWYRDYPDLFRIKDSETCKAAFRKIRDGWHPKAETTLAFLKSLEEVSVRGYIEGFVDKISKLTKPQSMKNIVEAIQQELKTF